VPVSSHPENNSRKSSIRRKSLSTFSRFRAALLPNSVMRGRIVQRLHQSKRGVKCVSSFVREQIEKGNYGLVGKGIFCRASRASLIEK